ncbi:hypothetical protein BJF86_02025 [Serinicoccus sp. CNJ-927]|uniref:DNA/RNA non-specific endonuclease n=1 Tax=Serinicoccus sp. CNJ-927 TaxID=1904970 RepID=UPI00095E2BB1|nr:DUF6571 family protein [Serinicoccus sp. CNJ-927]OLT41815.1 hypothetical protein BJF86_02025 [Serinicoccus sp. CNJ-927]
MATCSIHIPGFTDLVAGVGKVRSDLPLDRSTVSGNLSGVMLGTGSLSRVDDVLSWADGEVRGLHRRLAMAQQIEASTPGVQMYAQFDEDDVSTKSQAQVEADAKKVADYLEEGGEIPQEILDLLAEGQNDPYFAQALAERVDLEDLSNTIAGAGMPPQPSGYDPDYQEKLEAWRQDYDALLDGLGQTMGLASRGTGDVAPPEGWSQQWIDAITTTDPPGQASRLAAVVSRGRWSTDFTVELTQALYDYETGEEGYRGMWGQSSYPMGSYVGARLPDGTEAYDPMALVLEAVAKDPEAGMRLVKEAGRTTVEVEGESHQVSSFVDYLLTARKWPVDDGAAAGEMLSSSITPYEGGSTYSLTVGEDVRLVSKAFEEEVLARTEDKPWWSDAGHLFLDVLGLVPVIGEPIDGVNAAWYYAEGDVVNGSLTVVAMVPLAGWGGTGAKWGTKVFKGSDAAKFIDEVGGKVLDDAIDAAPVPTVAKADGLPGKVDVPSMKFTDEASFNAAANKAHPNASYEYNGVTWKTDEFGRTKAVEGTITEGSATRSKLQTDIGNTPGVAADTDVGFHLLGHWFGGPTNRLNVVPGNGKPLADGTKNLNNSGYAKMERSLRDAIRDPDVASVSVKLEPKYMSTNVSVRPDAFNVVTTITRKDGTIETKPYFFENQR